VIIGEERLADSSASAFWFRPTGVKLRPWWGWSSANHTGRIIGRESRASGLIWLIPGRPGWGTRKQSSIR